LSITLSALTALPRRVKRRLGPTRVFVDPLHTEHRAAILIGTGRSGTSKLADMLSAARTTRRISEPWHPYRSPFVPPSFVWGQYLAPGTPHPEFRSLWADVLSGRLHSRMLDQANHARVATRRLVKSIAATNMVPWLRDEFPHVPVAYLVRHPFAVATSMCGLARRRGLQSEPGTWAWQVDDVPGEIVEGSGLLAGPLAGLHAEITALTRDAEHPFDRVVLRWCLENWLALTQPRPDVPVVFYERLFRDPERVLPPIATHLGLPLPRSVMTQLDRPSGSDSGRDSEPARRLETRMGGWAADLDPERRRAGMTILEVFGLDRVYGDGVLPLAQAPYV